MILIYLCKIKIIGVRFMSSKKTLSDRLKNLSNSISRRSVVTQSNIPASAVNDRLKNEVSPPKSYNFAREHQADIDKDVSAREISNRNKTYLVANGGTLYKREIFFGDPRTASSAYVETMENNFAVQENGLESLVAFSLTSNETIHKGDGQVTPRILSMDILTDNESKKVLTQRLPDNIDINDLNAVRYALKDNEQVCDFMDKFLIVTDEEKRAYGSYESANDLQNFVEQEYAIDETKGILEQDAKAATDKKNAEAARNKEAIEKKKSAERAIREAKSSYLK